MAQNRPPETDRYVQAAEKRVAEKIGFYRHLLIYVVVNALLVAFNYIISPSFLWFLFPLGIWTIAVFAHFVNTFVFGGVKLDRWRKKEIEKELARLVRKE